MSDAKNQAQSQVESIVAMVAALNCDYDRLKELRDKAKEGHYVAGWNLPGYLPDSEPASFEAADDARSYIADAIRDAADAMRDAADADDADDAGYAADVADAIAYALEKLETEKNRAEYSGQVGKFVYWISYNDGLADLEEREELDRLKAAAGDCESEEDARMRIDQDPLSIEVRSGWETLYEELKPREFRVILCTGGPHVELQGDLDSYQQPDSVRVIYACWGESGEYFPDGEECYALLTYCRQFYFGE
jgi:hypothetical protein